MNQHFRGISRPRFGGISAEVATWLGSLDSEQKARLRQAAQGLLERRPTPPPLSSPSAGGPHGLVRPFRHAYGVPGKLLKGLVGRISQLRGYQVRLGLSDAQFARLHPELGSAQSWRHLRLWHPGVLNLSRWERRLSELCESLSKSEQWPDAKDCPQHPVEEFWQLLRRIEGHAFREHGWTSTRKLAKHAGFERTTYRRLTAPDAAIHFAMDTWLPRLRESVKRLGA